MVLTKKKVILAIVLVLLEYAVATYIAWHLVSDLDSDYLALYHAFIIVEHVWDVDTGILVTIVSAAFLFMGLQSLLKDKQERYGNAEWSEKRDITDMGLNPSAGLVFGKLGDYFIRMDEPKSALVLAPPGTYKTAAVVVPTLLLLKNSVVVHDPKGELYELTAAARTKFSSVFAFDTVSGFTATFNPFSKAMLPPDWDDVKGYIKNIASILIKDTDRDVFFPGEARNGFVFFACWLIWKCGETSFAHIRSKILGPGTKSNTLTIVKEMLEDNDIPYDIFETGKALLSNSPSENQWTGVVVSITRALEVFDDSRTVRATSGASDFNGYMLREKCLSLYLKIRDIDRDKLAPLIALIFEVIAKQLLSQKYEPKKHQKVTFIMDEFVRLGKLPVLKDLPSMAREYRVNVLFVAQDYGQIGELYGQEAISIFETNCAYKVILQQNNYMTAERISKLIGNMTDDKRSYSQDTKKLLTSKTSMSVSEEGLPLVSPQYIMNMPRGECILLAQGFLKRPLLLKTCPWFEDKYLRKLVKA